MENKISVIVPVYKVETYLHRCVDSLINQTHKNLEIILINDGSPDSSGEICDRYATKDNRIIVIHKKNEGSSCARNAGLDIVTGDYIAFVDSDDYINELMLETMLNKLLEHNLDVIEIKPKSKNNLSSADNNFEIQGKNSALKRIIKNTTFSVWCRLYKRDIVNDLRFIPKIIHQDVFYTIDVLNRINKIGYLNSKLYNYNTDNVSIIRSKYTLEKITIGIRATEYIMNNIPKQPDLQQVVNDYITYYYTDHYFLLSRNTEVDPNNVFRKKVKSAIKKSISFKNYGLRPLMVVILPYKIMEFISKSYYTLTSR
ncbi:glycosyl transferase family 2 [Winogradskyella pacifica]|uniref:Glycosyl transferase family 2 n=1 Tax=Winogradskyella pacifica TaxID=664642 RepID=A0A3D9N250_9FLAO|nr:glycosyltransferase [Winogradskyella pacifica]REE25797.1 glycosyl transferase family 2 [Winogradskyella pacifica]